MAAAAAWSGVSRAFFHSEMMDCTSRSRPRSVVASNSWMMLMASSASRMENWGLRPACAASSRSSRTPSAWKVLMVSPLASFGSTRVLTRSAISRAALLVKVSATMLRPM
ncbi:Uncharacterised protein [Bordetella pertussis]|nr:Uncharacterised protein [Bordetella pertussis]CFO02505.1 Uncharacterised protein [Bordetella pertussis]CFW39639.1 Uncharacterised protein [Bordetella pertussis]CPP03817.1 Uncharacterised protein [Bordetella pertussis]